MDRMDSEAPIQARRSGCPVPLTALQLQTFGDIKDVRLVATSVRVVGSLDVRVLRQSMDAVLQRHESLRTRIVPVDGRLAQQVDAAGPCSLEFRDLTELSSQVIETEAQRLVQELVFKPIDLARGPLFEGLLLRLSSQEHVLAIAVNHIIADGLSTMIIGRELWSYYDQTVRGHHVALPALAVQFGDYAVWQEQGYESWLEQHAPYWRTHLAGASALRLPRGDGHAASNHPERARYHFSFGKPLTIRLREIGRRERIALSSVLLAIYCATLSRWCEQDDFVIGFVTHGRNRRELANMVGYIASSVYLRVQIRKQQNFLDLLGNLDRQIRAAQEHRDFGRVPSLFLKEPPGLSYNWTPSQWSPIDWERLRVEQKQQSSARLETRPFPIELVTTKANASFKFSIAPSDTTAGIIVALLYRSDLFSQQRIERLLQDAYRLAERVAEQPLTDISTFPLSS